MASPGSGGTANRDPHDQVLSPFHRFDINTGTELWRKKLENTANPAIQAKRPRTVEGGIPPHLLFSKSADSSQLSKDLNNQESGLRTRTEGGLPPHLLFKPTEGLLPAVKTLVSPVVAQVGGSADDSRLSQRTRPKPLSQPSQSQVDAHQLGLTPLQSRQREATKFSAEFPITLASNVQDSIPHRQQFPPTPKYEDNNTQCYKIDKAKDNKSYHQQPNVERRPEGNLAPISHPVSGIRRKFEAKKSCDRESQSLPETVSSVKSLDGGVVGNNESVSDVRQTESTCRPNTLDPSVNDGSTEGNHSDNKEHSDAETTPNTCQKWVDGLPTPPVSFFLEKQIDRHFECDVEPINGFLMAPVEYPDTHINPRDKLSGQEAVRRFNGTAGLKSSADFELSKRLPNRTQFRGEIASRILSKQRLRRPANLLASANTLSATQPHTSLQRQDERTASNAIGVPNTLGYIAIENKVHHKAASKFTNVTMSWFLRPIQEEDLPQVLDIYNWEIVNGIQALDTKPMILKDMQSIFSQCRKSQIPFIVAVAGTPAEAVARKETPVQPRPYQTQQTGPYSRILRHTCFTPELDKILGFGFLSIPVTGLAGSIQHSVCRFQARAHIYIDATHRRKGIGRALLHKLTRCCSIYSVDMGTYEWFDPDNSRECDVPNFNPRNYSRLFVETASRNENDPDTVWYSKFLDSEGFVCVSTLDKARKLGDDESGQWLDNLVWQLELDCQDPKSITENHQNPYSL